MNPQPPALKFDAASEILSTLRTRQNELIKKFHGIPRVFDADEWTELYQVYVDTGCESNAASVAERIEAYSYIIRSEHTPMSDAAEDAEPWQTRKDVA